MFRVCANCGQKNRIPVGHLADLGKCGKCQQPLPPTSSPINADAITFQEIVDGARVPVLVDFWAEWCGPCKMAAPHVEKVAHEMAGRVIVLKVDTERYPELAQQYRVSGIPNFIVFKKGKIAFQQAGLVDARRMKSWIEQVG
jgi:thioredoxin 2